MISWVFCVVECADEYSMGPPLLGDLLPKHLSIDFVILPWIYDPSRSLVFTTSALEERRSLIEWP